MFPPRRHAPAWLLLVLRIALSRLEAAEAVAAIPRRRVALREAQPFDRTAPSRVAAGPRLESGKFGRTHPTSENSSGRTTAVFMVEQEEAASFRHGGNISKALHPDIASGTEVIGAAASHIHRDSGSHKRLRKDTKAGAPNIAIAGKPARDLVLMAAAPVNESSTYTSERVQRPTDEETVGDDIGRMQAGGYFLGLPKIFWALFADVFAMGIFILCIPLTLYIAKRRRPPTGS